MLFKKKEDVFKLKWKMSSFDDVYIKLGWFGYSVIWDRKLPGFNNRRSRTIFRTNSAREANEVERYFKDHIKSKRPKRPSTSKK